MLAGQVGDFVWYVYVSVPYPVLSRVPFNFPVPTENYQMISKSWSIFLILLPGLGLAVKLRSGPGQVPGVLRLKYSRSKEKGVRPGAGAIH